MFENSTYQFADFPCLGFNKNWITISCNFFNSTQTAVRASIFAIHYPTLRTFTFTGFRFDKVTSGRICAAPCQTYSATTFPTVNAFQATAGGGSDVFVARIDNATTSANVGVGLNDS